MAGLSWDCGPEHLDTASACGLGFLSTGSLRLVIFLTSYWVAEGSKNTCYQNGSCIDFTSLASLLSFCVG